jgi:hypothetical protein
MQEQARENLRGLVLISPLLLGLERVPAEKRSPLPMYSPKVSEIAPLVPTVITASGQRRLLNDTAVAVHYAPCQHILTHVTGSTVWLSTRHSLPGRA